MHVDAALMTEFPGLRALELELDDLSVKRADPRLETLKVSVAEETRRTRTLERVKDEPVFRAYRDFYWKVGIDPTKTRPAAEALTRRLLGGREIPSVNTLVDTYNLVSVKSSVAIAAFDAAVLHPGSLKLRRALPGEPFRGIGMPEPFPLGGGEVVIEDLTDHELVAVYPYRNAWRSRVTESTRTTLLLMCGVPGIGDETLVGARDLCRQWIEEYCRG
jgi:DNA/RNA-binding domain of Phe-tRNA-synthetase-like protein